MTFKIAMTSDNNYALVTATSIVSMLKSNPDNDFIFYIIDVDIDKKNRKLIENKVDELGTGSRVVFIPFTKITDIYDLNDVVKDDIGWPINTFSCLFIADVINEDKVLYVDGDTICLEEIDELWEYKMKSNMIVGGCLDTFAQDEKTTNYVNVGILIMDLKEWRNGNFSKKCFEYLKQKNGNVNFADQGVLNTILKDNIEIIHPKYNVVTPIFMLNRKKIIAYWRMKNYYTEEQLNLARKQPVFIHFTRFISVRPWEIGCTHPYKNNYLEFWNLLDVGELNYNVYVFSEKNQKNYNVISKYPCFIYRLYRRISSFLK